MQALQVLVLAVCVGGASAWFDDTGVGVPQTIQDLVDTQLNLQARPLLPSEILSVATKNHHTVDGQTMTFFAFIVFLLFY